MSEWVDKMVELGNAKIPYLHQGNTRNGADCVGLVLLHLSELGLDYSEFDVPNRSMNPPARALVRGLTNAFGKPNHGWDNWKVVVFRSWGTGAQHVGICGVDNGTQLLLHAHRQSGRVEIVPWHTSAGTLLYGFWSVPQTPPKPRDPGNPWLP